jgi:nitrite reductase (NO-forming)
VLRFKATRTGVFIYYCAPGCDMTSWHVVSGMSGAIMVLPRQDRNGNPLHYDRVYYTGESDFYIRRDEKGKFRSYASAAEGYSETVEMMRKLVPTHVVFNGRVGAVTGKNALTAKVGETVLILHSETPSTLDRPSRRLCLGNRQILQSSRG